MPPRRSMRVIHARREEEGSSSSSSDDEFMDPNTDEVDEEAFQQSREAAEQSSDDDGGQEDAGGGDSRPSWGIRSSPSSANRKAIGSEKGTGAARKISISLSRVKNPVCKVCGKKGHRAGFVGAVYMDCPNKPCYLCKQVGHTTATCPYRLAPGHGCSGDRPGRKEGMIEQLMERERRGTRVKRCHVTNHKWRVEAAILKLHHRRCCCLEFPPNKEGIVLSGDKQGTIAVWNYNQVHERTLYKFHTCLCNTIRFLPWYDSMSCASASSDGTVKLFDIETGTFRTLLDINPGGWVQGGPWHMIYGCDGSESLSSIMTGDSRGQVHVLDPRTDTPVTSLQLHKVGTKVVSIQLHPLLPTCILTAGNDHFARLFDVRKLVSGGGNQEGGSNGSKKGVARADHPAQLTAMSHPRVVNAAYFSPLTGQKILTTCQDNRIRVWDSVMTADLPADREIVHSHDFNRYLTPFKAEWDSKDPFESTVVCGRYISEDFGGVALHPVDILDSNTGELLHELIDMNVTTISPVNKPHPRQDIIISGSSRSLYLWTQVPDDEDEEDMPRGSGLFERHGWRSSLGLGTRGNSSDPLACQLQRNDYFVFFDADPGREKKKQKQKLAGTAVQDWDDED